MDQSVSPTLNEKKVVKLKSLSRKQATAEECSSSEEEVYVPVARKVKKVSQKSSKKKRVEMGVSDVSMAAQQDLELERKLSKKLKVKEGKLRGVDDGMNLLLEGMLPGDDLFGDMEVDELPKRKSKKSSSSKKHKLSKEGMEAGSLYGVSEHAEVLNKDEALEEVPNSGASKKKNRKRKLPSQEQEDDMEDGSVSVVEPAESCGRDVKLGVVAAEVSEKKEKGKYIAPHLRARAGNEPEEHTQIRRRVRGREGRDFVLILHFKLCVINCFSFDLNFFLQVFLTGFPKQMLSRLLENCPCSFRYAILLNRI